MTRVRLACEGFGLDHKGDQYPLFDYTVQELNHKEGRFIHLEHSGLLPRKNLTADIHGLIEITGSIYIEAVDLLGDTNGHLWHSQKASILGGF